MRCVFTSRACFCAAFELPACGLFFEQAVGRESRKSKHTQNRVWFYFQTGIHKTTGSTRERGQHILLLQYKNELPRLTQPPKSKGKNISYVTRGKRKSQQEKSIRAFHGSISQSLLHWGNNQLSTSTGAATDVLLWRQ